MKCKCCNKKFVKQFKNQKYCCRLCSETFGRERSRKWYQDNKEKLLAKQKDYYQLNKSKILGYQKEYKRKNIDKIKKRNENNKERDRKKRDEWYKRNREYIKEYGTEYRKKNKIKLRQKWHEYCKKKYNNDVSFRTLVNLRNRIRFAIKNNKKKYKTINIIGCSINKLNEHLEKQFVEGITWKNYGRDGWHIDHIIPCASFDLTQEEEQKKCFHYTNLQPLWAKENRIKQAKIK